MGWHDRPRSGRGAANDRSRRAWQGIRRFYFDLSVFESDDALHGLAEHVWPQLANEVTVRRSALQLVLPATARHLLEAKAGQGAAHASRLLTLLTQLPVDLLPEPATGATPGSLIVADCLENRHRFPQSVFTQSRDLVAQVQAGAHAGGSDRGAKGVWTFCVLRSGGISWADYDHRCRNHAKLDPGSLADFSRVLVDTCTLMFDGIHRERDAGDPEASPRMLGVEWLDQALPALRQSGGRLVIVQEVLNELEDKSATGDPAQRKAAGAALDWLRRPHVANLVISVAGLEEVRHGDPAISSWFVRNGHATDTCVLTQDRTLAPELVTHLPGPPRFSRVCRVNRTGTRLIDWRWEEPQRTEPQQPRQSAREAAAAPAVQAKTAPVRPPIAQSPSMDAHGFPAVAAPAPGAAAASEVVPEQCREASALGHATAAPAAQEAAPQAVWSDPQPRSTAYVSTADPRSPQAAAPACQGSFAAESTVPAGQAEVPSYPRTSVTRRRWIAGTVVATLAVATAAGLTQLAPRHGVTVNLVVDGRNVPLDAKQTATLPPGTRFTVHATVREAGALQLFAHNASRPQVPMLLAHMRAEAGQEVHSPVLRVEPGPGVDKLELVHQTDSGKRHTQVVYVRHR